MHYPGHLRDAFHEALWAYQFDDDTELGADLFWNESLQRRWLAMGAEERLMWIAGKLWHCTDIMPSETCQALEMLAGSTYAQACRRIRQGLVAPLQPV